MYIDGFVLPVRRKNLKQYQRIARAASKVWLKHGALAYFEAAGDDMHAPGMVAFPAMAGATKDEVVIFAWATFKTKAARNKANKGIMSDPQLAKIMASMGTTPPMECKRMAYGGFKVIVKA
jgi:uncharacterized protein YbaA (DUF1428 family)